MTEILEAVRVIKAGGYLDAALVLVLSLLTLAIFIIIWLTQRGVTQFITTMQEHRASITDLYKKYDGLNTNFNLLRGEHNALHRNKRKEDLEFERES